jgi:DNA polymerase III alpha subunit
MRLDKFNNPIFNEADIFKILYQGHISVLPKLFIDDSKEIQQMATIAEITMQHPISDDIIVNTSLLEYDRTNQDILFMPREYHNFDVETFCIDKCTSIEERTRVYEELEAFKQHNMMELLQWLKYFVDTCLKNDIVWGVGRGSSVASFVLYLIGVHRIHSIKYKLDWQEFLR